MAKQNAMSAAEAAKLIKRMVAKVDKDGKVVVDEKGNAVAVEQAIREDEIMIGSDGSPAVAEYEDRVVVVTTSGEKLTYEKPKARK